VVCSIALRSPVISDTCWIACRSNNCHSNNKITKQKHSYIKNLFKKKPFSNKSRLSSRDFFSNFFSNKCFNTLKHI
jgi:hypothetical protein